MRPSTKPALVVQGGPKNPFLQKKERWEANHVCPINFAGSAPAIEPEGVKRIDKLQIYHGLAIRRNKDNLKKMHDEVWAGLYHSASTDEHPQHQYCPKGADTWCKFYQDQENGVYHSHKKEIADAVVKELIPIYRRLSSQEMLKGVLVVIRRTTAKLLII